MHNTIIRIYKLLLHLYPRTFREQFGEELVDTFAEALHHAEEEGDETLFATCIREVVDLPISIVREHISKPRQQTLLTYQEDEMSKRKYIPALRTLRRILLGIIIVVNLTMLLVTSIFLLNVYPEVGNPPAETPAIRMVDSRCDEVCRRIRSDDYNSNWSFLSVFPIPVGAAIFSVFAFAPFITTGFVMLLGIVQALTWRSTKMGERLLSAVMLLINITLTSYVYLTLVGGYLHAWVVD